MSPLNFDCGGTPLTLNVRRLFLAGFAGRDAAATEKHIADMMLTGVPRPSAVPAVYPVIPILLTQADTIEVYGFDTVPEVEFVIFGHAGSRFVTVGNDQCDLEVEGRLSAEKSKNLCQKSVAKQAWPLEQVLAHWDRLTLHLSVNGIWRVEASVAALLTPATLLNTIFGRSDAGMDGLMAFSGTPGAVSGLPRTSYSVRFELRDPVLDRSISHAVTVTPMAAWNPP